VRRRCGSGRWLAWAEKAQLGEEASPGVRSGGGARGPDRRGKRQDWRREEAHRRAPGVGWRPARRRPTGGARRRPRGSTRERTQGGGTRAAWGGGRRGEEVR
jgi:hypothetical protein